MLGNTLTYYNIIYILVTFSVLIVKLYYRLKLLYQLLDKIKFCTISKNNIAYG